jgi:hypothetical protein
MWVETVTAKPIMGRLLFALYARDVTLAEGTSRLPHGRQETAGAARSMGGHLKRCPAPQGTFLKESRPVLTRRLKGTNHDDEGNQHARSRPAGQFDP